MEGSALLLFALGAIVAGFVAGLTGLGSALAALAFWLHVLPPQIAVPLAATVAVTSHIVTLGFIRHGIIWKRLKPFAISGLAGLPFGIAALAYVSADAAKAGLGLFLILYCSYGLMIRTPPVISGGGRIADSLIGFLGGLMGGLSSASGPIPTIWAGLRGWSKDEQRGVFQPFNLIILGIAMIAHSVLGAFAPVGSTLILITVAGAVLGALGGIFIYRRVSDLGFRKIVLLLLLVGGISHLISWLSGKV